MKRLPLFILLVIELLAVTACTLAEPATPDTGTVSASPPTEASQSPPLLAVNTPEALPSPAATPEPTSESVVASTRPSSATVVEITDENYQDEVLYSPVPVLIHFGADWAGPSRLLAPIMEGLANAYAGKVKVGKVNVDDYPALAEQFEVSELPTVIVINQGSEQARISGATSEEAIVQMLDQQLGSTP